ncbi:MAG TPA: MAPEG family protein [Sphingomonadaceae bacterium]|nr:MAPEG family protein [Sphingomonadaceae bacterium]
MILPVTLTSCAAAGLINIWLGMRIGRLRGELKVSVGDGGHESLVRRMRAQLNFAEYVPFVLLLVAAVELAGKGGQWLAYVAGVFILGRIAHALGMDGGKLGLGRNIGIMVTMLTLLGLSVFAVLIAARVV